MKILRRKTMRKMAIETRQTNRKGNKVEKRWVNIKTEKKRLKVERLIKTTKRRRFNRKLRILVCRDCN